MTQGASKAAQFLRSLGHEGRLLLLCSLVEGEQTVGALSEKLYMRQAAVSQQLALLRREGFVTARRDGRMVHYALADERVRAILPVLYELFCARPETESSHSRIMESASG